ncbi:DUF4926 domain-containing protein [Priestia megaterium]|uniref:DUF4926 domain-containing protein n=1 Tax=Priestia megaterium TaxID=1404 RepID=A0A6H1P4M3_PRIMG|nr:DUF4926 domain-containing protein [Priestia megaterium]QIZ08231.1 DUF4926 domain-containing protein [Priestia megaterium]
MKQFDVVKIKKDYSIEGITKGQTGTILEVYDDNHFEVEICDRNGITLFLGTLSRDFLEVVV